MRAPGQGAKTAAQILALALLRDGKGVQAFPEVRPERRGAPLRAFTRVADRPIRRHDTITDPDLVVVLEPSLVHEAGIADGLREDGSCSSTARSPRSSSTASRFAEGRRPVSPTLGSGFVNIVMLGAVAAVPRRAPAREPADGGSGDARQARLRPPTCARRSRRIRMA